MPLSTPGDLLDADIEHESLVPPALLAGEFLGSPMSMSDNTSINVVYYSVIIRR